MNLNSKLFDRIRIKSRHPQPEPQREKPRCAWEGCEEDGVYRAPKGHRAVGEYHNFCLEHVRHYNNAFNFFAGMNPDEVEEHVSRSPQTDDRPSWSTSAGAKSTYRGPRAPQGRPRTEHERRINDPLNVFARYAWSQSKRPAGERAKPLHEPDRRAFETLGFNGHAQADEIKKAYKRLVKIHHPDANGGDKSSEDRLRAIIAAYTHLKAKGFVAT